MKLAPPLSGSVVDSFAYFTIKDRLPSILTKTIDSLTRKLYTDIESPDKIKGLISKISELRYEITRDFVLPSVEQEPWKSQLETIPVEKRTWFKCNWLFVECLMYHLLYEYTCQFSPGLDLFRDLKHKSTLEQMDQINQMGSRIKASTASTDSHDFVLEELLLWSLWGNQGDLSLSMDTQELQLHSYDNIIINDIKEVKENLVKSSSIVIVLDNSGIELFADLLLARQLSLMGKNVCFYGKKHSWFVSDVTITDFNDWIDSSSFPFNDHTKSLIGEFKSFVDDKSWIYKDHDFFTLSSSFWDLKQAPDLQDELTKADFVIFKGDLNYRKMVDDRKWDVDLSFSEVAIHSGIETPFCMLRTCKSDTCVGISKEKGLELDQIDKDWMVNGKYGIIQYAKLSNLTK